LHICIVIIDLSTDPQRSTDETLLTRPQRKSLETLWTGNNEDFGVSIIVTADNRCIGGRSLEREVLKMLGCNRRRSSFRRFGDFGTCAGLNTIGMPFVVWVETGKLGTRILKRD
jgi:hypothetical protein